MVGGAIFIPHEQDRCSVFTLTFPKQALWHRRRFLAIHSVHKAGATNRILIQTIEGVFVSIQRHRVVARNIHDRERCFIIQHVLAQNLVSHFQGHSGVTLESLLGLKQLLERIHEFMKTLQKRSVDTAAVLTLVLLFLRRSCPLISLLALALNAKR